MQSLFRIRTSFPSGPALTRAALFSRSFVVPRVAAALEARRRTLHTSLKLDFPAKSTTTTTEKKAASTKATTAGRKRPAAKAKGTAKGTTKKVAKTTASAEAGTEASKPKAKAKPKAKRAVKKRVVKKRVVKRKKKASVVKKPRVTLAMAPPRGYLGSFLLFHKHRILRDGSLSSSIEEAKQSARDSGAAWHALTEAEKKPFVEQSEVLREEYKKKRAEYFENNDPKILRALNKKRVAKGLGKLRNHRPANKEPKLLSSYFRFLAEFRYTAEANQLKGVAAARAAGERWRAMSDEEKEVYRQAWRADKAEYEKRHES